MIYVFDNSSLVVLFKNFYRDRFPSLWNKFDHLISTSQILLVREVYNEIIEFFKKDNLAEWAKNNHDLFMLPSSKERNFVKTIFSIPHFQGLIRKQKILEGKPVADPFVIAKAKIENAWVVTEEEYMENAAKIPNVCEHFDVEYTNLQGFMQKESWIF